MKKELTIIGLLALLVSVLPGGCVGGALYWHKAKATWRANAEKIQSRVVGFETERGDNGMLCAPIFHYTYREKPYEQVSSLKSNPKRFEEGESITLFINPHDPNEVVIDGFIEKHLGPLILGGLAGIPFLILFVGGVVCLIIGAKMQPAKTSEPNT